MTSEEFRKNGYQVVDWVANYLKGIEGYPVKAATKPGDIIDKLPDSPPESPESFESFLHDLNSIIMPGITHWQHPNFHAYFPANNSFPSILAEIITAGIGAQCMVWETSPAATELEEQVMEWLKQMMDIPANWDGVIQDTASTATLAAILSAREKISDPGINKEGFKGETYRVYCSTETHSSIDKAVKIAGFGSENLVKTETDDSLTMKPDVLEKAIQQDIENDFIPCAVVATVGSTGTLAMDPVAAIGEICEKYNLWLHIDAAYAGSSLILPEMRHLVDGIELADSFVFNPHKWLFTNFDCSVYFVKDKNALIDTFEITPEYLKTKTRGKVNDYKDWGVPLGRRFRALKLWLVIRSYGVEGLQQILRKHIELSRWLELQIQKSPHFELLVPCALNMVVFRYNPGNLSEEELNMKNENLLESLNKSGELYISHTKIKGNYAIRLVTGQTNVGNLHVEKAWKLINEYAGIR